MLGEFLSGRYKVINVLGSGGFGHTYIAEDTQRPGNPLCVLKHLTFDSPNSTILQQVRRLFRAEAETLEQLGRHDQIPQLLAYFEVNQEFYLVQEFVAGRPLSVELAKQGRFSEVQAIALLEDVLGILEYVHAQGVIHRDIKPDNLIRRHGDNRFVLIDFGAVKTIRTTISETTGETNMSIPIYTSGYAASEHCLGKPQFSSDLYSLGMVAIQTLSGMRPSQLPQDFHTSEIIWRDQVQVSEGLGAFLERMTRYHHSQRYQSAAEALQALAQVKAQSPTMMAELADSQRPEVEKTVIPGNDTVPQQSLPPQETLPVDRPATRTVTKWLAIVGGTLLATGVLALGVKQAPGWIAGLRQAPASDSPPVATLANERISTGEKLLNRWQSNSEKQEGVARFAAGEFSQAIVALEAAHRQEPDDPETLIYLNNARIGQGRFYKLAVAVPLGDSFGSALEILRGVAQAQNSVNSTGGINGVPLKVAIANDDNQEETAEQLARTLAGNPEVLAVVGHGSSDTTLKAATVYQANQLPMVSPLSSAVQLSGYGNYIFRTMPSDRLTAKALTNYMLTRLKKRRAVVFYNSQSAYSKSLKTEFKNALFYNGVELVDEFDFSRPDFVSYESVERAIAQQAEVIMLAPDSSVAHKGLEVVQVNRRRLQLLAGDSVSASKVLRVAGQEAVGMVLAVPVDLSEGAFQQRAAQLWGAGAAVTWRTALAYDATQSLIAALRRDPTRTGIQRILLLPDFAATGADGAVKFLPTGDRQGRVQLMTIVAKPSGSKVRYEFQALP